VRTCTGRLDVRANRNLDQAVADEPPSGAQPRAGGLDLDRLRFGHQDGAKRLAAVQSAATGGMSF
jgi:hypothetical protein